MKKENWYHIVLVGAEGGDISSHRSTLSMPAILFTRRKSQTVNEPRHNERKSYYRNNTAFRPILPNFSQFDSTEKMPSDAKANADVKRHTVQNRFEKKTNKRKSDRALLMELLVQCNDFCCQIQYGHGVHQVILSMYHQQTDTDGVSAAHFALNQIRLEIMRFIQGVLRICQKTFCFCKIILTGKAHRFDCERTRIASVHDQIHHDIFC